jgi:hypothetical protein
MPSWEFKKLGRGDKIREPILGEFFSTDAIKNSAEALVRESIQNSLDASVERTARVRFFLSGSEGALPAKRAQRYFEGAWPHYAAAGNGLQDCPRSTDPCPFLVCEDFGTRGLQGDPAQWFEIPDVRNNFFYFFRTEGRSAKGEGDRGRWGIGKYVFPRSSRVRSFFAVTVRADDRKRLLMGQAVLKSHRVNNIHHQSDGWFGIADDDGLVLPTFNQAFIEELSSDFRLTRGNNAGLSIVVPWCEEEIEYRHVLEAVTRDYFYAILKGDLVVDIETPRDSVRLSASTILEIVEAENSAAGLSLVPLVHLARSAIDTPANAIVRLDLPPTVHSHKWKSPLFKPDEAATLRERHRKGEQLAFRVPVVVRPKNSPPADSFFDVFVVRDDSDESGRPLFIREGIIISDVRAPRTRGTRALVVIEDPPLATLLGDAENPAHTQWQKEGSNYKGKYVFSTSYIEFVTRSVAEIVLGIVETEQEADVTLLTDYFSVASLEETETDGPRPEPDGPDDGPTGPGLRPERLSKPKRFRVDRITGGFSVRTGDSDAPIPQALEIRAAYDVRRGDALTRYRPDDFRLFEPPMSVDVSGGLIVERGENKMVVAIHQKDFSIAVTGFDENRDLFLRAFVRGEPRG